MVKFSLLISKKLKENHIRLSSSSTSHDVHVSSQGIEGKVSVDHSRRLEAKLEVLHAVNVYSTLKADVRTLSPFLLKDDILSILSNT